MKNIALAASLLAMLSACAQPNANNSPEIAAGAVMGAAAGAGLAKGSDTLKGAVLGAAVGSAIGAAAGNAKTCKYTNTSTGETWTAPCS